MRRHLGEQKKEAISRAPRCATGQTFRAVAAQVEQSSSRRARRQRDHKTPPYTCSDLKILAFRDCVLPRLRMPLPPHIPSLSQTATLPLTARPQLFLLLVYSPARAGFVPQLRAFCGRLVDRTQWLCAITCAVWHRSRRLMLYCARGRPWRRRFWGESISHCVSSSKSAEPPTRAVRVAIPKACQPAKRESSISIAFRDSNSDWRDRRMAFFWLRFSQYADGND